MGSIDTLWSGPERRSVPAWERPALSLNGQTYATKEWE